MKNFERIRELLALTLGVPESAITTETSRENLAEWDSMRHLELMLALEEQFDLRLDVDDMAAVRDVAAIDRLLEERCPSV